MFDGIVYFILVIFIIIYTYLAKLKSKLIIFIVVIIFTTWLTFIYSKTF